MKLTKSPISDEIYFNDMTQNCIYASFKKDGTVDLYDLQTKKKVKTLKTNKTK